MAQSRIAARTDEFTVLELTRRFEAPREAVFRAWTNPEALAQWFGPENVQARDIKVDLRRGGRYSLVLAGKEEGIHPLSGSYREITAPSRLVFTFAWGQGDLKDMEMLVTLDFAEVNGGTQMTLVQERNPTQSARESHSQGWNSSFKCLDSFLAA